jgi:hypothetical protein
MNETKGRSVTTLSALENVGAVNLDMLLSRAAELQGALRRTGELEPGVNRYQLTVHVGSHASDVVSVAAEVQRLGFAIERVQQR